MEAYLAFGETNILNRAMNLAYFEMLGDPEGVNQEMSRYNAVTAQQLQLNARLEIFRKENCQALFNITKRIKRRINFTLS